MRFGRIAAVIITVGCGGGGGGNGGTPPPPPVASVAISPSGEQSIAVGDSRSFSATTRDAQGNLLSGRPIAWTVDQTTRLAVNPASGATTTATALAEGSATLSATSEGIKADVPVTVTVGSFPTSESVTATVSNTFDPSRVDIAAGGTVTWTFATLHNVTFSSSGPTGGNIADRSSGSESRTFPNAGDYPYVCTLHAGMSGLVVVH